MTQSEMATHMAVKMQSVITPVLVQTGLEPLEKYSANVPSTETNIRELIVLPANGECSEEQRTEVFYVQMKLPGELQPDKYLSAIWPYIRTAADPEEIGMLTLTVEYQIHYEHQIGDNNAMIELVLTYTLLLDDTD